MITVSVTVDIKDTIRTAVDPSTFRPLSEETIFFLQGDVEFIFSVFDNKVAFDLTAIGDTNLLLSIKKAGDPDGEQLVLSSGVVISGGDDEIATFTADTATVEMAAYLANNQDQPVLVELVDNTDSASPQTMARIRMNAINRGFDGPAALPVYANIKHKITVEPDRIPISTDDASDGFSLGSIWLYFNLATPDEPGVFINEISTVGSAVWIDLLDTGAVDSVFGRIGDVVALINDYAASLVDNDSTVTGATVKDALETLSAAIPAVPVDSVFGRIGAVIALINDYAASLIDNDSTVSGATVKDALETLAAAIPTVPVDSVFGRTGAVIALLNDYTASLVDNDSTVVGATVKDALEQLNADIVGTALPNYKVPVGETLTIQVNKQHLLFGQMKNEGEIIAKGELVLIGAKTPVRQTITKTTQLRKKDKLLTIDASAAAINIFLDNVPNDGQSVDIYCINADNLVTVIGTVNGLLNPTLDLLDSIRINYNSTINEWELR